jgi:mRNA-degrading endonuclease RelE of RelBE toxin-antitoxin system
VSAKKAKDVIGTREFRKFFSQLHENEPRKKELLDTIKILQENYLRGNNMPHNLWPQIYVKKYGMTNLWRFPLHSGWRLIYTIKGKDGEFIICIIEALSHHEYEKRFGY